LPARQLFATGRAPTALAAFIKRPQAVRFKSALILLIVPKPLFVKEKNISSRRPQREFASPLGIPPSNLVLLRCAVT
jgi:hypothetical protein